MPGKKKKKKPFLKRTVKDTVFSEIFKIPAYQVELLRTLYPGEEVRPEDITDVTIKNVVSTDAYNDLSLLYRGVLVVLIEAQSVMTANILVRFLEYMARIYKDYIVRTAQDWYGRKRVTVPRVDLYVVYVGQDKRVADGQELSLTKEFFGGVACSIEVRAKVICEPAGNDALSHYIRFSKLSNETVAEYGRTREAAERIVKECIAQNILPAFFEERMQEVIAAMVELFSQQEADRMRESAHQYQIRKSRQEGKREGIREGKREGMREGKREGKREGIMEAYLGLAAEGLLSIPEGARRAGINENEFSSRLRQMYPHFHLPASRES